MNIHSSLFSAWGIVLIFVWIAGSVISAIGSLILGAGSLMTGFVHDWIEGLE